MFDCLSRYGADRIRIHFHETDFADNRVVLLLFFAQGAKMFNTSLEELK